jgi:hypothetical protein
MSLNFAFDNNRILNAVAKKKKEIEDKVASGTLTQAKVDETCKALDMDLREYCRFQELKSLAVASNLLTLDEGQTVYAYLGESLDTFNTQPVEVKVVLTGLFKELLERSMRQAS